MDADTLPLSLDEQIKNLITGIENAKTVADLRDRLGAKTREIYDSLDTLGAYHRDGWWYVPSTKAEANKGFLTEGHVARNNVRQKGELRHVRAANRELARLVNDIKEAELVKYHKLEPLSINREKYEAGETAIMAIASDWHVGADFIPEMTSGRNSYNLEIAEARIREYFSKLCDQIEKLRTVRNVVSVNVCLLGDLIDGQLHESSRLTGIGNKHNAFEQIRYCQNLIAGGLLEVEKIFPYTQVITAHGNHGRITEKRVTSQGFGWSHEQFMYEALQEEFRRRGSKIHFYIKPEKRYTLKVMDKNFLISHGDSFKAKNFSSLDKYSQDSYRSYRHDHLICGHFHYAVSSPFTTVNGSLMGLSPYAYEGGYCDTEISQTTLFWEAGKGIQNEKIYIDA